MLYHLFNIITNYLDWKNMKWVVCQLPLQTFLGELEGFFIRVNTSIIHTYYCSLLKFYHEANKTPK